MGFSSLRAFLKRQAIPWGLFFVALVLIVIRPMGLHFSIIPGVYGDTRLINFVLEHFYNWILGAEKGLWDTVAFYPYPLTLAFSDNLLGVAPFYVPFRLAGLDRESALQGWFLLSFGVNFGSCVFVLNRLGFQPVAVAAGAFLFTFGLPILSHESHMQLIYRAGVPLAGWALWRVASTPHLSGLAVLILITAWQIYAGIYIGVLLIMLLAALLLTLPFFLQTQKERGGIRAYLLFWPQTLRSAWEQAGWVERGVVILSAALAGVGLAWIFRPYVQVQHLYGFARSWEMVSTMLPRVQSYFVADQLPYWKPVSIQLWGMPTMRNEHQLFIGWVMTLLVLLGGLAALRGHRRPMALAHLAAVAVLVALTLYVNGFTLYKFIYDLPGMNSIRSVTRVQLVLLWPYALLVASGVEWALASLRGKIFSLGLSAFFLVVIMLEPLMWKTNVQFVKRHARERLEDLRAQLPSDIPADPILFLAAHIEEASEVVSETDGMLLAQDLGWHTFNGYFGNFPPGYRPAFSCGELPARILNYMRFAGITDPGYYLSTIRRAVPLGFTDCDPAWWSEMPALESLP
jgi:hypothetical protein